MSKRNERANPAPRRLVIAAAIVGAFLLLAGIASSLLYKQQHTQEGDAAATYQTQGARGEIQAACVHEPRSRTYRCTADVPVADQHDPYAEHDLRAQQDMARWAYIVAFVSFGTLLLTGAGVMLLWWTLEATREAVDQARAATDAANASVASGERAAKAAEETVSVTRQTGQAQARCYPSILRVEMAFGGKQPTDMLFVDEPNLTATVLEGDEFKPKVFVHIKNLGQSPCRRLIWRPSIKYAVDVDGGMPLERQSRRWFPMPEDLASSDWGEHLPPGETRLCSADLGFRLNDAERKALKTPPGTGGLRVVLVISLRYFDVFDNRITEDWAYMGGFGNYNAGHHHELESMPLHTFEIEAVQRARGFGGFTLAQMGLQRLPEQDGQ